jgi:hypothetical protein
MQIRMNTTISRMMMTAAVALIAGTMFAQLKPNQTQGFGDGQVLKFTYTQNFDCIDQPMDDLNYNSIPAQSDPSEMQTPICVVAHSLRLILPGKLATRFSRPNRSMCWFRCFRPTMIRIRMMRFHART